MALSPTYAGFDRKDPPPASWLQALYSHSDFYFVGGYLTHGPGGSEAKNWGPAYQDLLKQGWGLAMFAVPYSRTFTPVWDKNKPDDDLLANATSFGQALKALARKFDSDQAGCVIVIDNEDPKAALLSPLFIKYYAAIFDEMQRPSEDGTPPIRAGFYAQTPQIEQMLKVFPDFFPWPEQGPIIPYPPYSTKKTSSSYRIKLKRKINEKRLITIPAMQPAEGKSGNSSIGLGTQFVINDLYSTGQYVPVHSQVINGRTISGIWMPEERLGSLAPQNSFDFDFSFVRDPRFPHANPRFDLKGSILIRGLYQKDGLRMNPSFLDMAVNGTAPVNGDPLEPEAPLVSDGQGNIFSINKSGHLTMAAHKDGGGVMDFAELDKQVPLRRIRSLVVIEYAATTGSSTGATKSQTSNQVHVFWLNKQNQLFTRRLAATTWSDPVQIGKSTAAHPFSNLACTHTTTSVDVFFLNAGSQLCVTSSLLATSKVYPVQNSLVLNPANPPSDDSQNFLLLNGTSLSAVSPSSQYQLVFGISRTLHLTVSIWLRGSGWSAPQSFGGVSEKLFAHSRLSAYALKDRADCIYVGVLSDKGVPVIYKVTLAKGKWTSAPRVEHGKQVKELPKTYIDPAPGSTVTRADDYAFNPWGDIVVTEDSRGVSMAVVGTHITTGGGAVLIKYVSWATKTAWMRVR